MATDDQGQGDNQLAGAETDRPAFDMRQFVTRYFALALDAPDVSEFTELFVPDGVLEDPVGTPPLRGREAIGQFLAAGRSLIEHSQYEIRDVLSCGHESAVRWSAVVTTRRGQRVAVEGIGIFSFDDQRKLRSVREFYDVRTLQQIFSA
ncbi:MAG TPA: nuclear transport factor 2 family protein [Kofleriaceae bacterium]